MDVPLKSRFWLSCIVANETKKNPDEKPNIKNNDVSDKYDKVGQYIIKQIAMRLIAVPQIIIGFRRLILSESHPANGEPIANPTNDIETKLAAELRSMAYFWQINDTPHSPANADIGAKAKPE